MQSSVLSIAPQRLVALARPFQVKGAGSAIGRCLSISLDVAVEAQRRLGLDVKLVKWRVVNDPNFVDHWAVMLDDERVIDVTRVQVDGKNTLVCGINDYPANFRNRRVYPAHLLTSVYQVSSPSSSARLSDHFLWRCGTRLFAFDLAAALRERHLATFAATLRIGATFLRCFLMAVARRALDKRARTLLDRLPSQPAVARHSRERLARLDDPRAQTPSALAANPFVLKAGALAPVIDVACAMALLCT
jgi:hypothetical protein